MLGGGANKDIADDFAPKPYDYASLCDLFTNLARNNLRPTPIIKLASIELCKLPYLETDRTSTGVANLISTLVAISNLNYPSHSLISKLLNDLERSGGLSSDIINPTTLCNLLRAIAKLRWRPKNLLDIIYDDLEVGKNKAWCNYEVIETLIHVTAFLNPTKKDSIQKFYSRSMNNEMEQKIMSHNRSWLSYVCSLVNLNLANRAHLESVLNDKFYEGIKKSPNFRPYDVVKLLNLTAIAQHEFGFLDLDLEKLNSMTDTLDEGSSNEQDFRGKIRLALQGFVDSPTKINNDVQTPFGFKVDCEFRMDESLNMIPIDPDDCLESLMTTKVPIDTSSVGKDGKKCALIFVPYAETILNHQNQVVGHKTLIARILANFGITTIFITEPIVNQTIGSSSDLTKKIKNIILVRMIHSNMREQ